MINIRDVLYQVVVDGLAFARDDLVHGPENLDAESWSSFIVPATGRDILLRALTYLGIAPNQAEGMIEANPIPADRATHEFATNILRKHYRQCYVVGQMATDEEWSAAESATVGTYIFCIDAIDGALPYETLTFGYSINVLAYRRDEPSDVLLAAAVANSSGLLAIYEQPGSVYLGHTGSMDSLRLLGQPAHEDCSAGTVALLASDWTHRSHALKLMEDPTLTVFTTGGAPASLGILAGKLETLAASEPQTIYDAAYLPMLAALGVTILSLDGTVLTWSEVFGYFRHVARSPNERNVRPVPPFVASRSLDAARQLAQMLKSV